MFDIIRSYIAKEDYYLIILNSGIYIKNYQKLIGIKEDEIIIAIEENLYRIKGSNFILTKSIDKELMIKGCVESVVRL